ncbi:MAG: hypothetical protein QSU88_01980 [Candidatus Methanoperedens sp.]|nr:hypothetical protein [Candidatus Methanoperedens sp.]
MKSPCGAPPCLHGRHGVSLIVTRREAIESMGDDVSAKKRALAI